MAQGTSRGSSRRVSAAPVRKPFPWGFAAGVLVLVLALGGILFYAATNTGSGFKTAADKLDEQFKGIEVSKNPSSTHVTTRVNYPGSATKAPDGGNHNPYPQTCQAYDAPIVNEHAVHSMEHGAVWITYRPDLPADQVAVLKALVQDNPYRMLSPYPGQSSAVGLQAWGRRLELPSATDARVQRFVDDYTNGPQTREKGASCSGVDQPGTVPFTLAADGKTFVPGPGGAAVPGQGTVPSGAAGSASPGSPATVPSGDATSPAAAGSTPAATASP